MISQNVGISGLKVEDARFDRVVMTRGNETRDIFSSSKGFDGADEVRVSFTTLLLC